MIVLCGSLGSATATHWPPCARTRFHSNGSNSWSRASASSVTRTSCPRIGEPHGRVLCGSSPGAGGAASAGQSIRQAFGAEGCVHEQIGGEGAHDRQQLGFDPSLEGAGGVEGCGGHRV